MQMRDEVAQVLLTGSDRWARIEFRYDWMGRRISKMYQTTNDDPAVYGTKTGPPITWSIDRCVRYVWDGWHLSLSYRTTSNGAYLGPDQSFAWGPDLSSSYGGAGGIGGLVAYCDDDFDTNNPTNDPDLGPMYPIYDGNGNVVRMCRFVAVSSGGFSGVECRTAAAYEYGPFGEALSVTGEDLGPAGGGGQGQRNPFRFSTKYTDAETGLVYYGYRYYSHGMGRWVSRDPIGEADGPNVYAFVRNGPTVAIDLLGKKRLIALFHGQNFAGFGGARTYMNRIHSDLTSADNEIRIFDEDDDNFWARDSIRWIANKQREQDRNCKEEHIVVLVGHSNGGDGARKIARHIQGRYPKAEVNLLFLIDPVGKPWHSWNSTQEVSSNVNKAINYYQRQDTQWVPLPGFRFWGYKISPGANDLWALDPTQPDEADWAGFEHSAIAADDFSSLQTPTRARIKSEVGSLPVDGPQSSGRWQR
ncbi:MAG: RHS repeat-associated core domain-containing protein [Phycisphaeraceae bacterium]|nr:RHS repeat-associated core domain-containing protein [Phycisphaeraceae bacterium]